jgi:uncharacterized DUF497 family protein
VVIVWERKTLAYGAAHILDKHNVTEAEVEQVIFEVPPLVEAKRNSKYPGRTAFIGRTRLDRELVVICEDWNEGGKRHLKPITAFEPSKGRDYWEEL